MTREKYPQPNPLVVPVTHPHTKPSSGTSRWDTHIQPGAKGLFAPYPNHPNQPREAPKSQNHHTAQLWCRHVAAHDHTRGQISRELQISSASFIANTYGS